MYHHEIPIGAPVTRTSGVAEITEKTNSAGRKAIVKIAHSLQVTGESEPAITETQTYVLLPAQPASQSAGHVERADVTAAHKKVVTPDETMLFQYSALGFNSHKIHLDRNYARDVEGFPDLVVNGGLTTLLLTEFARRELSLNLSFFTMKNLLPLFCGRPVTLTANRIEERWSLKAHDEFGRIAAEMEAQSNEL
jgi:3-methylfumaryl-CoA hydratase